MRDVYQHYYRVQSASGIQSYAGIRYQRGHGFWRTIWKKAGAPLLSYLGKQIVGTTADIANDALSGKNVKEAAKKRLKERGKVIMDKALDKVEKLKQSGTGRRRKRRVTKKRGKAKRKRTQKGRGISNIRGKKRVQNPSRVCTVDHLKKDGIGNFKN